jgi:predicted MFS family arabinose efflux permease
VIVATASSGTLILTLWLLSANSVQIFVFAGLYGLFASAFTSLAPALVAQISIVSQIGTRSGVLFAIISFAVLLGSLIGGQLIESRHGSFTSLQVFCGVTMLLSACAFLLAKFVLARRIMTKI